MIDKLGEEIAFDINTIEKQAKENIKGVNELRN